MSYLLAGCVRSRPALFSTLSAVKPCITAGLLNRNHTDTPTLRRQSASVSAEKPKSFFERFLGPQSVVAKPSFKGRWLMFLPAFATHMCIGSPYAWSTMSGPVSRELGFVAASAGDWSFAQATIPMSFVFALHGITAALAGKWQMKVGQRCAMATAGVCFGGALMLGSVGIATHNIWLLYLGYGALGGIGLGLSYTPPIQALIDWFPDKKGLASGVTIAGFGSGALLFAPSCNMIMQRFSKLPEYLGTVDQVETITQAGKLFAKVGDQLKEVVLANATDLALLPYSDLAEGYYVVGTGNTGAATALGVLGVGYLATMLLSAFTIRTPAPGYVPAGYVPPPVTATSVLNKNVHVDTVMKTPQFYLLASTLFFVATGGMGMLSVAKPMMSEVFSGALPGLVTAGFASTYLLFMAGGNLGGRLGWASFSDRFGRRKTFTLFTVGSIPLYFCLPYFVQWVVQSQSTMPLFLFCGSTVLAISCMGGTYASLPAYEADLFGTKYVGAIHGRILLASTGASLAGPSILLALRKQAEQSAIYDLLKTVDPQKFVDTFGEEIANAGSLIEAKTITISKLMAIMPPEVVDPTPFIYNSTMYTMAGFMAAAALSHYLVRGVNPKHFEKTSES